MNPDARHIRNYLQGTDRCSCPDVADLLRNELSGERPPPCPAHDAGARQKEAQIDELNAKAEAYRATVRDLHPPSPPAPSEKDRLTDLVGRGLAGMDTVNIGDAEAAFMRSFPDTDPPTAA